MRMSMTVAVTVSRTVVLSQHGGVLIALDRNLTLGPAMMVAQRLRVVKADGTHLVVRLFSEAL